MLLALLPSLLAFSPGRAVSRPSSAQRVGAKMAADAKSIAILGASGYTGAELCRLLLQHPGVSLDVLTSERYAGKAMSAVFPQFVAAPALPALVALEDVDWSGVDLVFACLPHATTQQVVVGLPEDLKIVDLSADFRLSDIATYEEWYGPHHAKELQQDAVYGLTELCRDAVSGARLVANPGCYPTAAQLALIPLLRSGEILPSDIIIDAKSGATGAGRAPKEATLFCEVADGIHAYGVASHRHAPEIEQGLTDAAGAPVRINFTPHLMPMSRGIFESIYVKLADGKTAADLRATLHSQYEAERFVTVLPDGTVPQTRHVRGSNQCIISVVDDRIPGRAILFSVIDNLVKGASGQAVQNMNVMLGFAEETGIGGVGTFP